MANTTNSIYYSRTETEEAVVIVWKPFSTYSTYILLAIALVGLFNSLTTLSLGAFLVLAVNAVIYSTVCKDVRNEINEASRKACVQVKGNKFSLSSPLTIIIPINGQCSGETQESSSAKNNSSIGKKVFFGLLAAVFLLLGLFVFSAFTTGVRQGAFIGSLIILIVLALFFFLLAFLCFRKSTK